MKEEDIAKYAADQWCRCWKCDKIVKDIDTHHYPCDKIKLFTCQKWYDGYRTALLTLTEFKNIKNKD